MSNKLTVNKLNPSPKNIYNDIYPDAFKEKSLYKTNTFSIPKVRLAKMWVNIQ